MLLENIELFLELKNENKSRKNINLMTQNYLNLSNKSILCLYKYLYISYPIRKELDKNVQVDEARGLHRQGQASSTISE